MVIFHSYVSYLLLILPIQTCDSIAMLVIKLGKKSGGLEAWSGNLAQHGEIPSECAHIYI